MIEKEASRESDDTRQKFSRRATQQVGPEESADERVETQAHPIDHIRIMFVRPHGHRQIIIRLRFWRVLLPRLMVKNYDGEHMAKL